MAFEPTTLDAVQSGVATAKTTRPTAQSNAAALKCIYFALLTFLISEIVFYCIFVIKFKET